MDLPIEIWQQCLFFSDFLIQIRLRCVCKIFHAKLEVHDFSDDKYTDLLTDDILQNYPFIKVLRASRNPTITNVNHMSKLEILIAEGENGIDTASIANINLKILHAWDNSGITDVNHMSRLERLYAGGDCGINDKGIANLNLKHLNADYNPKITDVNHMNRLEILYAQGNCCGISNGGFANINLKELYSGNNPKITHVIKKLIK